MHMGVCKVFSKNSENHIKRRVDMDPNIADRNRIIFASRSKSGSIRRVIDSIKLVGFLNDLHIDGVGISRLGKMLYASVLSPYRVHSAS